jgi:acetoin utilization deacetylase AcuC-like enzyme
MGPFFFSDERFSQHTVANHPEHAGRLEAVQALLKAQKLWEAFQHVSPEEVSQGTLSAIHHPDYLDMLASTAGQNRVVYWGSDTYITPQSYELAKLAVGGLLGVVKGVLSQENGGKGMAAIRPPGHHATPKTGMGFCLLNNIALAARYAQQVHGLKRVAIVDFDVHHGNGTQDAFYEDPSVLFISSHQSPLYPGTGAMGDIGGGEGRGYTVNIPLTPQSGDVIFAGVYEKIVAPLLRRYQPELILVSAGFDAHWIDPLAQLNVSLMGFNDVTRQLIAYADELCGGRIVFVMEGGYDLKALSHGWLNIALALLGRDEFSDPLGSTSFERQFPDELRQKLQALHGF